jgi:monoamine oxidase
LPAPGPDAASVADGASPSWAPGFSGLACAYELLSAGYEVVVLDARNRVGGRVLSFNDMVAGKVVEGGGELIGSNHPTWVSYAKKFGLSFNDVTESETLEAPVILVAND